MLEIPDYFTKILSLISKKGINLAEVFFEKKVSTTISCEDNRIEKINLGIDQGVGLRIINNFKTSYAFTNDISEPNLRRMAESLACTLNSPHEEIVLNMKTLSPSRPPFHIVKPYNESGLDFKTDIVRQANHEARSFDSNIRQAKIIYSENIQQICILNTEGERIEEERPSLILMVQVVASKNNIIQTGYEAVAGRTGLELLTGKNSPQHIAKIAAQRAIKMLDAAHAPTGPMTVVLSSEAGGTMIHEAIGHGLEADLVQKGMSVFSNLLGKKVASHLISVIDDATLPGKRGSYGFDDEGIPAQRTILVEEGILKEYIYDRLTAIRGKKLSTGNGRRESYQNVPIPRMTNTFIAPGNTPPADIIATTHEGLFVKKMGGGQVDTVNGDFVFEINEGYMINKGKITHPVRGATLIGNGPKILQNIDMVGSDIGFQVGTCGKDGQAVPVSDAQPTLRLKHIIVGGQSINS